MTLSSLLSAAKRKAGDLESLGRAVGACHRTVLRWYGHYEWDRRTPSAKYVMLMGDYVGLTFEQSRKIVTECRRITGNTRKEKGHA